MRVIPDTLAIKRILENVLGSNSLQTIELLNSGLGSNLVSFASRRYNIESKLISVESLNKILDMSVDYLNRRQNVIILQISMFDFRKLAYSCESIAMEIKQRNVSLIILIQDFSTLNLEMGFNPFAEWSKTLGLIFSQHPKCSSIFLVDFEYRFNEVNGKISGYKEFKKINQVIDQNHEKVSYFVMEDDFIKRMEINEIYLLESITDLNNFDEIYSSYLDSNSRKISISCDQTGIFFRRPHIKGMSITNFLKFNSPHRAANLLLQACRNFSNMKHFPNDLRPWNLVYDENSCFLIDFPKNISCDDDVSGFPNFLSLLALLQYLKDPYSETYNDVLSKMIYSVCNHAEIYNESSFLKLEYAWLNLDKYIGSINLFFEGNRKLELILDEVFYE